MSPVGLGRRGGLVLRDDCGRGVRSPSLVALSIDVISVGDVLRLRGRFDANGLGDLRLLHQPLGKSKLVVVPGDRLAVFRHIFGVAARENAASSSRGMRGHMRTRPVSTCTKGTPEVG